MRIKYTLTVDTTGTNSPGFYITVPSVTDPYMVKTDPQLIVLHKAGTVHASSSSQYITFNFNKSPYTSSMKSFTWLLVCTGSDYVDNYTAADMFNAAYDKYYGNMVSVNMPSINVNNWASKISLSKASITDNYNNSFTVGKINMPSDSDKVNNRITSYSRKWWYKDNTTNKYTETTNAFTNGLAILGKNDTRTVVVQDTLVTLIEGEQTVEASLAIKQYLAPTWIKGLSVRVLSVSPATFEIDWTDAVQATNSNSKIKEYGLAVAKQNNASWTTINALKYDSATTKASITTTSVDPGNPIKFTLEAFTAVGSGSTLTSSKSAESVVPSHITCTANWDDHYNNTCTFTGVVTEGYNNPITVYDCGIDYEAAFGDPTEEILSGNRKQYTWTRDISIEGLANRSGFITFTGMIGARDSFNDPTVYRFEQPITNYVVPNFTDFNIGLTYEFAGNAEKGPLFTCSWSRAAEFNESSPVCGYKIHATKDNVNDTGREDIAGLTYVSDTKYLIQDFDVGSEEGIVYTDSTSAEVHFYPKDFGVGVGKYFYIDICPYTRYGQNNTGNRLVSNTALSTQSILPGGVVRIKVNDGWTTGQVFVRSRDASGNLVWKPASAICVKHNGAWKYSI